MAITQLIYSSVKVSLGETGIFGLLDQARISNERDGITGVLVFSHYYFLQLIEGEREQVTKSFLKIAADKRHTDVTIISVSECEQRQFPRWTMGSLNTDSKMLREAFKDLLPDFKFFPAEMGIQSSNKLLKRMVEMDQTYDY